MSSPQIRPEPGPALLALYDDALPQVYGYLLARCGRRVLAEDLTSETFLAAAAACRRHPPPAMSTGWLVGIARHKLVDHWRAAEREERGLRSVGGPDQDIDPWADDPWDAHLDALLAHEVLAAQTGTHRAVLTLRYLDGLPVPEVARTLGRTVRATESLLTRARTAYRHTYTARSAEGGPR
ncbi:RNA polymerase sigma factor [Pseudonocardia saturnea]